MQYFFESSGSIVDGVGFSHWSNTHVFWLVAFVVICAVCSFFYRKSSDIGRKRWRFTVAGLIVLDEILKMAVLIAFGNYNENYLPLHLCSINIFIIAIHVFKPSKTLGNFLYAICIPAAILALLFPTWTKLPFANLMHWHSFTVHILLALYPIMLTVGGDIKPDLKYLPRVLLLLLILAIPAYAVNCLFDTNYMFLMEAEKGNPLYWFERNWGNHILGIPVILVPTMAMLYIPWTLAERERKKE